MSMLFEIVRASIEAGGFYTVLFLCITAALAVRLSGI